MCVMAAILLPRKIGSIFGVLFIQHKNEYPGDVDLFPATVLGQLTNCKGTVTFRFIGGK